MYVSHKGEKTCKWVLCQMNVLLNYKYLKLDHGQNVMEVVRVHETIKAQLFFFCLFESIL